MVLIGLISGAKKTIQIASYMIIHPQIIDAINNAEASCTIIQNKCQEHAQRFTKKGTRLGFIDGDSTGLMHHKFAIYDGEVASFGSLNWTMNSINNSYEDLHVCRSGVDQFKAQFNAIWAKIQLLSDTP